tara:strand:- start:274 stop:519 length:246 start_codon:yes stop_codon:yes gene_type:complete
VEHMEYQDKLLWLADRLRNKSNPRDQGWKALAKALGLGSQSHLKERINRKSFTTEQDLAAQMLMTRLKRSEKLKSISYTIQ